MLKLETLDATPRFVRMLLAAFVATAVGAASGVGIVFALLSASIGETPPIAMPTKGLANLAGASNSGIQGQELPSASQREPKNSPVGRAGDSRNDGLSEVPRETASDGAVTVTSTSAERQEHTQLDRRSPRLAIHRGRAYSRRFANTPFTSPISRPW